MMQVIHDVRVSKDEMSACEWQLEKHPGSFVSGLA